jgi:hypothetical protein
MKKLLAIVVLGFSLTNCDQAKPDFLKAIENCADYQFEFDRKMEVDFWIKFGKNYKKEYAKEKLEYWKTIQKKKLNKKMMNKHYPSNYRQCQSDFDSNPKIFKEKWL